MEDLKRLLQFSPILAFHILPVEVKQWMASRIAIISSEEVAGR